MGRSTPWIKYKKTQYYFYFKQRKVERSIVK